ncbi:hypothetical protein CPC08DRAFT_720670 [Agrocybe pediades]|nr:hypothetical protein CPC08DRAFT_720670 [Agrocybe pediades]
MSVQIIQIDDQNPAFSYSPGDWTLGGSGNEFMNTTMRTVKLGASMRISFVGKSASPVLVSVGLTDLRGILGRKISVYGSLGPSSKFGKTPTSLFSIDDGRAVQFIGTQDEDISLYQQKFYESPDLELAPHVLLATISDVPSDIASFVVDYAEITNPGSLDPSSSSAGSLSSSSFASATSIQTSPSVLSSPTDDTTPTSPTSNAQDGRPTHSLNAHVSIIVGAVLGFFIVILLLVALLVRFRRRGRSGTTSDKETNESSSPVASSYEVHNVVPFVSDGMIHSYFPSTSRSSGSAGHDWNRFRPPAFGHAVSATNGVLLTQHSKSDGGRHYIYEDPPDYYDSLR